MTPEFLLFALFPLLPRWCVRMADFGDSKGGDIGFQAGCGYLFSWLSSCFTDWKMLCESTAQIGTASFTVRSGTITASGYRHPLIWFAIGCSAE